MTPLSYETAKKLKEAGFPQKEPFPFTDKTRKELEDKGFDPTMYFPTLSELIAACGEDFKKLHRHSNGKWAAYKGTKSQKNTRQ